MLGLWTILYLQIETTRKILINEIFAPIVVSATTFSEHTYFTMVKKGTSMPYFVFYVWDHFDDSIHIVEDGRVPARARFVMELKGEIIGYSYADPLAVVWDTKLQFKRTDNLFRLLGLPELGNRKLGSMFPYGPGKKLITLRGPNILEVGLYSENEPFRIIHHANLQTDSATPFFAYSQGTLFLFESEIGRVQVLDAEFRSIRTLHKGFKRVPDGLNTLAKRSGLPERNATMVHALWSHPNVLQVWYTHFYDFEGNRQEPKRILYSLRPGSLKPCFDQRVLIGSSLKKDLLFDPAENALALEPHTADRY